nr:mucin-7-like [Aegilops tauschii subsp. strangulata]
MSLTRNPPPRRCSARPRTPLAAPATTARAQALSRAPSTPRPRTLAPARAPASARRPHLPPAPPTTDAALLLRCYCRTALLLAGNAAAAPLPSRATLPQHPSARPLSSAASPPLPIARRPACRAASSYPAPLLPHRPTPH